MNKAEERLQMRRVFGPCASRACDCERPDFLLETPSSLTLGIEVTSFYSSNADAKLKNLSGYTGDLLDRKRSIHRADVDALKVDELTILKEDGSIVDKVTGIIQQMPSPQERMNLLFGKIAEKERKIADYLENCGAVDLVIVDESYLFYHQSHEQFYSVFHALAPKNSLISSAFREIHLVTTTSEGKSVYVPLIASIFFADCFAYEHALQVDIDAGRPTQEIFKLLAACLWYEGYSRAKVSISDDGVGFFCGAWEIFFANDGIKLRDWVFPHVAYAGVPISQDVADISTEILDEARALVLRRTSWFSAIDVRLPTYDA